MSAAQPAAPAPRVLVFELEIPIRWGDMDAMGHVNNALYFRYMEQVRVSWFDALGIVRDRAGQGPVIVDARCSYLRELRHPGTVLARQYIGAIGRSSIQTYVDLMRTDDPDTVYAMGEVKVVWVDHTTKRSTPLSEAMRQAILEPRLRR